jgi:hypothetical protein
MKIGLNLLAWSVMAVSVSGQCSLCPGGATSISNVNAQLHDLADSCGVIEAGVSASSTNCNAVVSAVNVEFDFTSFCCSDTGVANIECAFCEGGSFDATKVLSIETNPQGLTCEEAKGITDYTRNSETCRQILVSTAECCEASCALCPTGSTMSDGNRLLPGQSVTCGDFDVELGAITAEDTCTAKLVPFADYDLEAYCGCTGVPNPNNCDFCEFGLEDRNAIVADTGGFTCSQFERLADFIKSPGVCDTWQECCSGRPANTDITIASSANGLSLVLATLVGMAALVTQM